MRFRAVLISQDTSATQLLTRVFRDLEVEVESCANNSSAMRVLAHRPIDAIIVDTDEQAEENSLLESARELNTCKSALGIALNQAGQAAPPGSQIILYKPISMERVVHGLRAIRNLMARERRSGSHRIQVEIPASIKGHGIGMLDVVLVDISDGGAAIRSPKSLPATGLLTLECQLPGTSAFMKATSEVVWDDTKTQFGVRFVDIASGSRTTLVNWLVGNVHMKRDNARSRGAGK